MRNFNGPQERTIEETLKKLTELMRLFAEVDKSMGKVFKQIAASGQEAVVRDLSLAEIHFIAVVEAFSPINGALLTQKLGITKGGVSRMAARLLSKGMIESERIKGNRKSQYYALTENGKVVSRIHDALHKIANEEIVNSMYGLSNDELSAFNEILNRISVAIENSSSEISANYKKYLDQSGIHLN